MEFKRPPEYFSQWGSLEASRFRILDEGDPSKLADWQGQGFRSESEYRFWSDSSCGVACVQSLLQSAGFEVPSKATIIEELVAAGAYKINAGTIAGLIYEPCVVWLRERWNICGTTFPQLTVAQLYDHVAAGGIGIASVSKEIRRPLSRPTERGGHLVFIFGAQDNCFTFHDPSGLAREDAEDGVESARGVLLPVSEFEYFYANRAMIFLH